jgi:type IV secretion system protein VirB10
MSNQNVAEQISALPGEERGMPSVNETGPSTAKRGVIVIVLLLVMFGATSVGYWKFSRNSAKASEAPKNLQLSSAVPARTFKEPPPAPKPEVPLPEVPVNPPAPPGGAYSGGHMEQHTPSLDKSGSPLMAVASKSGKSNLGVAGGDGGQPTGNDLGASGGMAELLTSTKTSIRNAGMLGNRNFILAKGSFIDCALQTRLDSTVPGMTACVITRNIYSDNGKVLLIERGSTVTGEYKSNMRQGMARIFVLWSRIKTPYGVIIPLDSPGTDPLGGGGLPGHIDTHFWQRFGGALMLSLVDDVARGITSSAGNNNQFNFNSTGDAAQEMAAEALRNTINIPPTLYKNQGEQVGIYVARDLDFSSVYDVAAQ